MLRSCASPEPIRSPTTTSPVAIPTRALSGSRAGCVELPDAVDQRQSGPDRAFGVIFVGLRIAKVDEHAVAHEFGDVATISADDILDLRLVRTQELLQIFRIKAGGESCRAHEVAKHHRELSPFGVIAEPLGRVRPSPPSPRAFQWHQ